MKQYADLFRRTVNPTALYFGVTEIAQFHRIQASTGFREAAQWVNNKLRKQGIESKILTSPAQADHWNLTAKSFQEWTCRDAWLYLPETGEYLADYQADPISIIQRSHACDYRNQDVDVVLIEKGSSREAYAKVDLKGKLIFVQEPFAPFVEWAVHERGALGIITDCIYELPGVRTRQDLYDIRNYTSFWWKHTPDEVATFGYVLTPRQGDALAERCRLQEKAHQKDSSLNPYVQVRCYCDASLYDGSLEVVEATIKGETSEEILLVAHLCHPRSSANDNASGVACGMEVLRVLKRLQDSGELPRLKRSIKVLFVPEFSGTYAWLNQRQGQWQKSLAGLNLDMVGGRQAAGYGPLTISDLPASTPSFIMSLATLAMDEVRNMLPAHSGVDSVSGFNSTTSAFDPGSDHYIFSDPTVNIPMLMLGQWPDVNYHTSGDSIDVVDPAVLHKSASFAALFVTTLANLSENDAEEVLLRNQKRLLEKIHEYRHANLRGEQSSEMLVQRINALENSCLADNETLLRFFHGDARKALKWSIKKENAGIKALVAQLQKAWELKSAPEENIPEQYALIPKRLYVTPVNKPDDYCGLCPENKRAYQHYAKTARAHIAGAHRLEALIQFHVTGTDTVWEIAKKVRLQSASCETEHVLAYLKMLEVFGLISFEK